MNAEKLKRLQAQVRIGGKGTPRRKKKVTHQTAATDDKKLQSSLKKLSVSTIPGIEEVNIIKDDLTVIHFNNPKAQASLSANTFAVTGHGETKKVVEMLPEILPQLGQETVVQLRMFANSMTSGQNQKQKQSSALLEDVTDDVPLLVEDFDEIAKQEASGDLTTKPNTKTKNKIKETNENQQKQQPKPDQTSHVKQSKIDDILNTEAEKKAQNDETKLQSVGQTPLENQSEQIKEKQVKKNKKIGIENLNKNKETPKEEQQTSSNKEMPSTLNNKEPNKENKKNTPSSADKKNEQKSEDKKVVQTPIAIKSDLKDIIQKESQQSLKNSKTQQVNTNKNKQPDIAHKETQQPKKNQNAQQKLIKNNQVSIKEVASAQESILKKAANKENKTSNVPKKDLNEKSNQVAEKSNEEKISPPELQSQKEDVTKPDKNSFGQVENITIAPPSQEINQASLEPNVSIKDLALPIPPIIPPQPIAPLLNKTEENTIQLELKKETDSVKLEALNETNEVDVIVKDKQVSTPKENILLLETVPSMETTPLTEEPITVSSTSKSCNEPPKLEESGLKIPKSELTDLTQTIIENQTPILGPTEKTKIFPQQRTPVAAKIQSNQKSVASPNKQPAPQQQKQTPDSKKSPTNTENKKDNETPKGKPIATKQQPGNNSSPIKSQPLQQQQPAQKGASTAQSASKINEKQAVSQKPTSSIKSGLISKKPGTGPSSSSTSKPGNPPADNKKNTNLTANKSKAQAPSVSQRIDKPLSNTSLAAGVPQTKPVEKPATLPQLPANQ